MELPDTKLVSKDVEELVPARLCRTLRFILSMAQISQRKTKASGTNSSESDICSPESIHIKVNTLIDMSNTMKETVDEIVKGTHFANAEIEGLKKEDRQVLLSSQTFVGVRCKFRCRSVVSNC